MLQLRSTQPVQELLHHASVVPGAQVQYEGNGQEQNLEALLDGQDIFHLAPVGSQQQGFEVSSNLLRLAAHQSGNVPLATDRLHEVLVVVEGGVAYEEDFQAQPEERGGCQNEHILSPLAHPVSVGSVGLGFGRQLRSGQEGVGESEKERERGRD
jgi:hypothetical protein